MAENLGMVDNLSGRHIPCQKLHLGVLDYLSRKSIYSGIFLSKLVFPLTFQQTRILGKWLNNKD